VGREGTDEQTRGQEEPGDRGRQQAEERASAAMGRAGAEEQRGSAEAGERRDGVEDLSDGDLRRLIQEFVERRRAIDERARNATAMSGSIAVNDDDVLRVRRAFGKEQELGAVLARLCGVVHASGAEVGAQAKAKYASDFILKVQMHRIQGGGTLGRS